MTDLLELTKGYKRSPTVTNSKQWPVAVKARFIEPGLVDYTDLGLGMILVQRPFLNKVRDTFVGKPVIDAQHKDAKPENFQEIADGVVIRVWNDATDGWDWCEFLVWDEDTLRHTRDPQFFVSCAYDPTRIDRNGGKHHNVSYDGEFLDGSYTHLAIVKDPRYEGAKIVWNSVGAKPMKTSFLKLFKRAPAEEAADINPAETFLEVDGEKVSVQNAVELIRAENAKGAAKNGVLGDDDVLDIDGKRWTGKQIKNAVANAKAKAKNKGEDGEKVGDQDEAEKDEKAEGDKMDKGEEATNDIEGKPQKEDEARRDKVTAKNAVKTGAADAGKDHLGTFRETAEMRNNQPGVPTISTQTERLKVGNDRYGKTTQEAA